MWIKGEQNGRFLFSSLHFRVSPSWNIKVALKIKFFITCIYKKSPGNESWKNSINIGAPCLASCKTPWQKFPGFFPQILLPLQPAHMLLFFLISFQMPESLVKLHFISEGALSVPELLVQGGWAE